MTVFAAPELVDLILPVLQETLLGSDFKPGEPLDGSFILYGKNGALDSLGLVNLIVGVEQAVEDKCGCSITLADERALSQENSPFTTVNSLAEYLSVLLNEQDQ